MKKQTKKAVPKKQVAKKAAKKPLSKMSDKELKDQEEEPKPEESQPEPAPQQPENVENVPQTEQPASEPSETITLVQRNYLKAHFPAVPDDVYDKPKEDAITEIERLTGHERAQIIILLNAAK